MPTAAFLLMIAGGLWLALWQTRWRLAGAALIAAGLALAPTLRLPDLLVGAMARSSRCARRAGSYRRLGEDARRSSSGAGSNTTAISARRRKRARPQASSAMQSAAGRGSRGDGGGGAAPRGIRRRLPSRQHPRCLHRQPEELLGAEGCRRLLRRAPRGHARALHRGRRQHPHRDGGADPGTAAVVERQCHTAGRASYGAGAALRRGRTRRAAEPGQSGAPDPPQ